MTGPRPDWPLTTKEKQLLNDYDFLFFGHPDFFKYWNALRKVQYQENVDAGRPDPMDGLLSYEGNILKGMK